MATTGGGWRQAAVFGLALPMLLALAARAAEPEWKFDTSQRPGEERSVATAEFGGSVEDENRECGGGAVGGGVA